VTGLRAEGFPADDVRARARSGPSAVFPPATGYGADLFGGEAPDTLDDARLVPPVFMPRRLARLIDLGREPLHGDVELDTVIGGFNAALPVYVSAFGSTGAASAGVGLAVATQAGRLGVPMVIGENVVPVNGYGPADGGTSSLVDRITAYGRELRDDIGGCVVQQSTQDADTEVWNLVYSHADARPLLESGRLAFELKVGQGAKPGLGGMTVLERAAAERVADRYSVDSVFGADADTVLRYGTPGTFTEDILRSQVRLMRNNFPRARVWVKLPPGRDVAIAADVAWSAGADAVTVDSADAGTGWAPLCALRGVGLPLGECLLRIGNRPECLLVSGRMWEGTRAVKALALGATAVGLGRAALLAADEDTDAGLERMVACLALELRLLVSSLGKYRCADLDGEDVWWPANNGFDDRSGR
jgi:hypothetical protein